MPAAHQGRERRRINPAAKIARDSAVLDNPSDTVTDSPAARPSIDPAICTPAQPRANRDRRRQARRGLVGQQHGRVAEQGAG